MKQFTWIIFLLLSITLGGCVETNITNGPTQDPYKYTYDLTINNFTDHMDFSHRQVAIEGGNKKQEVLFEMKYPDGILMDVQVKVLLQTQVLTLGNTIYSDEFSYNFTKKTSSTGYLTYPAMRDLFLITITEISGKVLTNDETIENAKQAAIHAKQGLDQMLEKFLQPFNTLSTESYIHMTVNGETTTSFVKQAFRNDPYYNETIYSDNRGVLMKENSDGNIDVFSIQEYQLKTYIEKELIILSEDIDKVSNDEMFELKDSWTYRVENGDYLVSGSSKELFNVLFTDDETIRQWNNTIRNKTIEIVFADLGTRLLVSVELMVGLSQVKIETYYTFNSLNALDLSQVIELPPKHPDLAYQVTDLSQTKEGFMLPNVSYFYQIEVTGGTYVFDVSYPVNVELLDEFRNPIEPEAWVTFDHLLGSLDRKYSLEAGIYYVKMNHNRDSMINFSITMHHLEDLYDTIGSPNDDILLVDWFELSIEGEYDEVYVYYESFEEGYIVLTHTNQTPLNLMYVYNDSLLNNQFAYTTNGELRIQVVVGINLLRFNAPEALNAALSVTFVKLID